MNPRRRTLADRNTAAIAKQPASDSRAATTITDTVKLSAYLDDTTYLLIKSAFLADWQDTRIHDRFADWITHALTRHAHRSPQERAELDQGTPTGSPHSFTIARTTRDTIETAMSNDQHHGTWPTISAWTANALQAAATETITRRGSITNMPTPPNRLPQRLR